MAGDTGKNRVIQALRREEPDRIPTFEWDINSSVVEALIPGGGIFDIVDHLDLDGIVVRPDYSREKIDDTRFIDEWGSTRRRTKENISVIIENPIGNIKDHRAYRFPDPSRRGRFDTLERAVKRFGDKKAIILNLRDIFSDIRDLVGYENALIGLVTERDYFEALLDRVIEYNRTLAEIAVKKYSVRIIATTDDIAGNRGLIFDPKIYFDFLSEKFRTVISGFKKLGCFCIKHCDGDITAVLDDWIESGVDCIDPIDPNAGMDLASIKHRYGGRIALKGNVDCQKVLTFGSPEDVEDEVKRCITAAAPKGGYILSSSNMIHSGVKPENYTAMIRALKRYGERPCALGEG